MVSRKLALLPFSLGTHGPAALGPGQPLDLPQGCKRARSPLKQNCHNLVSVLESQPMANEKVVADTFEKKKDGGA